MKPVYDPKLQRICIALGVIGVVIMFPFDAWFTRLGGMAFLVAFVITGVFLIANPAYLSRDSAEEDRPEDEAVRRATGQRPD
jgi:hypothetical protein